MGEGYSLDVVSIRLVKDASIMSDHRLASAEDVATLMGDVLRDLDREVVCVINLRADGTHCLDRLDDQSGLIGIRQRADDNGQHFPAELSPVS